MTLEQILFFIVLSITIFAIVTFIIFTIITTTTDEKFLNSPIFKLKNNYIISINFKDKQVGIFDKDNSRTFKLTYLDFMNLVVEKDKKIVEEWFNNNANNLENDESLLASIKYIENDRLLVLKLNKIAYKDETLYVLGNQFDEKTRKNIEDSKETSLVPVNELKEYVSERIKDSKFKGYQLFALNFKNYKKILNRYGNEIANQYVLQLATTIKEELGKDCLLYSNIEDQFILYTETNRTRIKQMNYAKKLHDILEGFLYVDIYRFEIEPIIGVSSYKTYSTSLDGVLNEAIMSSRYEKVKIFKIYDRLVYEGIKIRNIRFNEYKRIRDNFDKYVSFYPIHSLITSETIGNLPSVNIKDSKYFDSLKKMHEEAIERDDVRTFQNKLLVTQINKYLSLKNHSEPLYIYLSKDMLRSLIKNYRIEPSYKDLKVVGIMMDYNELLNDSGDLENLIKEGKNIGIVFGLSATETLTVNSTKLLRYMNWLVLPNAISKNISNDENKKNILRQILFFVNRYNLRIFAHSIDSYKDAAILKDFGVNFMEGSLLDDRDNLDYSSIRKVAKLMDKEEGE